MNPYGTAAPGAERVLVVIVNYRTGALVVNSLRSLAAERRGHPGTTVVVVDNDSGDGSAERIATAIDAEGWSAWARLERSALNGGFAHGNNLVVRPALAAAAPPDFVWLLNPDTEVWPGALGTLLDFLRERPRAGIAGSRLFHLDGRPWCYAFRFPSFWTELDAGLRLGAFSSLLGRRRLLQPMGDEPTEVDWMSGASLLVRRAVFDAIGLLDEGYFLYYEETDFCRRAARAGWQRWYVPQSHVMHIAGQSTGLSGRQDHPRRRPAYWFASRRRYFLKHHGLAYTLLTDLAWLIAFGLWRLRRRVLGRPDKDPPSLWCDFLRHSTLLKRGLPGREAPGAVPAERP